MNSYWQQWSAREIDYCLGRDFRALAEEDDIDDTDSCHDEDDTDLEGYELSMDSLGFSNSDFF